MRALGKIVLAAALLALAAWAGLGVALRSPSVRGQIATRLAELLSDDRRTVTISSLGGSLPFAPTAEVVEIADRRGTWLRIENLAIEIDPRLLLLRHVNVRAASADRVVMSRLPEPDDEPFHLKPVRLLVTAKRIEARAIELGAELLGLDGGFERTAPIAAEAKGWVDLRRLTLAVDLSASTSRLDELLRVVRSETPISTSSARLEVKAKGAIATPSGEAKLAVTGVRRGDVAVGGFDLETVANRLGGEGRRYRVALGAHTEGLVAPPQLAQWLGTAPALNAVIRFGATPKVFDVDALKLQAATFSAELVASGKEDGRVEVAQIAVTWPDLRSAPSLSSTVAAGTLRVRGTADVTDAWTAPGVEAKLSAAAMGLEWVNADARRIVGPAPQLNATLRYDRDSGLIVDAVRVLADAFHADGSASVSRDGRGQVSADIGVPDVAVLAPVKPSPFTGAVVGTIKFDGTLDVFDAAATVRPQGVRARGADPLTGDVTVRAHRDRGALTGDASARLSLAGQPVRADGRYAYDIERAALRVDALAASLPGVDAEASGEVQTSPLLMRGHARARGANLTPVAAWLGLELAGEADVALDLDHDGKRQRTRVNAAMRRLRVGDLSIAAATLDVAPGSGAAASRFTLTGNGSYRQPFVVQAAGTLSDDLAHPDITFERCDGTYAEHSFAVRRPVKIAVRDGDVSLRDGALDVAGGTVEGAWSAGGRRGVGRIRFTNLPAALVSVVRGRPGVLGHLTGEITRARAGADLEVRARSSDAGITSAAAPGGIAHFGLDASARVSARRTRVESSVVMPEGALRVDALVELPVGIDGADARGKLSGHVAGAFGAEMVGQLFLPEDDRINGRVDVALDLGGSLQSPTAVGKATGAVRYTSAATGMELRIEQIDVRADGQRLTIAALKGNDGRGGTIDGRGNADFSGGFSDAVYEVEVAFLDTYLARIDEVRLRGDGALQLTGRGRAALLKGGFTADEAVLRVPDRMPPDVATLPVEHVNVESSRNPPAPAKEASTAVPLALDLALQFPGHLRVEDPNLDSEWRGDLFIRRDTSAPDVQGKLKVIRGNFGLGGVQFRARDGSLSFDEGSNVPTVDITAVANRNEIEATLRLHGRIDRAELELRSEPPLPQDEILSRLMFGTATTTLTAGQSIQLAQAVARLSGRGPGIDVLGGMRRYVGVDRIEIKDTIDTTTGTTTTAISVGKYVNDRIYVSLDQAVRGEGSKARVEVELSKHIAAETEVGQNQNALVALKWRWNY